MILTACVVREFHNFKHLIMDLLRRSLDILTPMRP